MHYSNRNANALSWNSDTDNETHDSFLLGEWLEQSSWLSVNPAGTFLWYSSLLLAASFRFRILHLPPYY